MNKDNKLRKEFAIKAKRSKDSLQASANRHKQNGTAFKLAYAEWMILRRLEFLLDIFLEAEIEYDWSKQNNNLDLTIINYDSNYRIKDVEKTVYLKVRHLLDDIEKDGKKFLKPKHMKMVRMMNKMTLKIMEG